MEREAKYGDIGWAVAQLRLGHKLRRRGWNGKNMWLAYVPAGAVQIPQKFGEGLPTKAHLVMKTPDDEIVAYPISTNDILSEDWELAA